jgi:hypothetical protein
MEIIEIRDPGNEKAIEQFHKVATRVYQDDEVWVPQSEMMFTQRFRDSQTAGSSRMVPIIALEDGQPVARGVAFLAPGAVDETGYPQGWIGFFECVKSYPHAARCILERCEKILQQAGVKSILLPKADNQLVGLLIKGFELPHIVFTNHNPPYYLELLKSCGYRIKTTIYTVHFTREAAEQVQVELPGFTTREFDRNNLSEEIVVFHELQQAIFGGRPGYIRRTLEEDRAMVQSFLPFIEDDLVIIAEDSEGNAVGLLVCLPDVYQAFRGQEINRVRIMSIGAIPHLTHKGIGALMGAHLMRNLIRREEFVYAEGSWVLGHNVPPRNLARRFHAKPGREFALLEKSI